MHAGRKDLESLSLQSMRGTTTTQSWGEETSAINRASKWREMLEKEALHIQLTPKGGGGGGSNSKYTGFFKNFLFFTQIIFMCQLLQFQVSEQVKACLARYGYFYTLHYCSFSFRASEGLVS